MHWKGIRRHTLETVVALATVFVLTGARSTGHESAPLVAAAAENWCLHCHVVDANPDEAGTYNIEWGMPCKKGQSQGPEVWGCAHCLNENDDCFEYSGSYGWDGPCNRTCCPTEEEVMLDEDVALEGDAEAEPPPRRDCDEQMQVAASDPAGVLHVLATHSHSFQYDAERDLLEVVSCSGEILRATRPSLAVRKAILSRVG